MATKKTANRTAKKAVQPATQNAIQHWSANQQVVSDDLKRRKILRVWLLITCNDTYPNSTNESAPALAARLVGGASDPAYHGALNLIQMARAAAAAKPPTAMDLKTLQKNFQMSSDDLWPDGSGHPTEGELQTMLGIQVPAVTSGKESS